MLTRLVALAAALCLAACTTTGTSSTVPVNLPGPPAGLSSPCPRPVTLPTVDTDQQDSERLWATDRTDLSVCANRQAALVASWLALQQQFAGAAK